MPPTAETKAATGTQKNSMDASNDNIINKRATAIGNSRDASKSRDACKEGTLAPVAGGQLQQRCLQEQRRFQKKGR
jgi:hypothetical protein